MAKIRLTQQAHIEGYEGAFLREKDENGKALATGIYDVWYEAAAEDENGNEYTVYWDVLPEYKEKDAEEWEDENVCTWDAPFMVINEDGQNVKGSVTIEM